MTDSKHPEDSLEKGVSDVLSSESSSNAPSEAILKTAHRRVDKRLLCWYAFVYLIMRVHVR